MRLAPITATGNPTDRHVTIAVPTDLLHDLLCDLADATAENGNEQNTWDELARAVRWADRDDADLIDFYSEDAPQPITVENARELAESERDEALAAVVRTIDLAQVRIPAAEARRLANALILAAYHAERQAS